MTTANIDLAHLASELALPVDKVRRTLELLDDGNTVPFITRFRKDQTGGLNEEQVQRIQREAAKEKLLADRKLTILRSIESQGKLVPELAAQINSARTLKWLEDVYLPFKPKKQTLATAAKERGLEPLAAQILAADPAAADLNARAAEFVSAERGVTSVEEVLQGVRHILAEQFGERPDLRGRLRRIMRRTGVLTSARIETTERQEQPTPEAPPHQNVAESTPAHSSEPAPSPALAAEHDALEHGTAEHAGSSQESAGEFPVGDLTSVEGLPPLESEASDMMPEVSPESVAPESAAPAGGASNASATEPTTSEPVAQPTTSEPAPESPARAPAPKSVAQADKKMSRKRAAKERKRKLFEHAFKDYYDFREPISRLPPHRVLAINRGERAKVLRVKLECNIDELLNEAIRLIVQQGHPHANFLADCVRDALQRLVVPSLEREIRRELTEEAEEHAVKVFAGNLRKLLLQPPVRGRRVLAVDPAFRSGCKLVALDEFGNVLEHGMIHVIGNEEQRASARATLSDFIRRQHIGLVAIGNGTACRETEQLVSDVISNEVQDQDIAYVIVNEAGASVYSTSQIGREELPHCDAMMRSAVSIGRRLLDPLSELVKINPANIGVGMYQHDVKAKHLRDSLDAVVNSCVNFVGVDVNTASPSLLSYVSGLNQLTARRLYEYRLEHGPFRNREQLRNVPGIGEATFVQAAGFLKITSGDNPLDSTWIHPESYHIAQRVLEKLSIPLSDLAAPSSESSSGTATLNQQGGQPAASDATAGSDAPTSIESAKEPGTGVEASDAAVPSGLLAPGGDEAGSEGVGDATSSENLGADEGGQDNESTATENTAAATTIIGTSPAGQGGSTATEANATSPASESSADPITAGGPSAEPVPLQATPSNSVAGVSGAVPARQNLVDRLTNVHVSELSKELGIGELTLRDILAALSRPGRDPRDDFSPPPFRKGIMKLDDLKSGMELQGTVLNVVDFGAFVDIGISDSALIHISKLADRYIRDPQEVVSVGDVLKVWVLEVDRERRRVSLTAIDPKAPPRQRPQRDRRPKYSKPSPAAPPSGGGPPPTQAPRPQRSAPPPKQIAKPRPKGPPPKKKPPKPVRPITTAMLTGKQPMRSFSDLIQYYEKKKQDPNEPPSQ